MVERYDRKPLTTDSAPGVERLHQEDFCQAQNIVSEPKYQKEGGPSFKQCFFLLRNVSTAAVMAMRIGRDYSSDKVTSKDFEQLAGDAGLAKPPVRCRVPELATAAIEFWTK